VSNLIIDGGKEKRSSGSTWFRAFARADPVIDRRTFIASMVGYWLAVPLAVNAQQEAKIRLIGILTNSPSAKLPTDDDFWQVFTQTLRGRGFIEGQNVRFEWGIAEFKPDRYPTLAADFVRLNCDVIVVGAGDAAIRAAKDATTTIPIVMAPASDPVRDGFVASFARPGGNITGNATLTLDLSIKRLEFLKAAVPKARRVVHLWGRFGAGNPVAFAARKREREAAAQAIGVQLIDIEMTSSQEFERATSAVVREHADALLLNPGPLNWALRKEIADFATRQRLPAIAGRRLEAVAGTLMSYGPTGENIARTAAEYVDKILRGSKPADLPVEQVPPELVINMKTAKELGLTIPQSLLVRAKEVID
jgi:putative tryptophan/tyrosine transport system substrate-binding protein